MTWINTENCHNDVLKRSRNPWLKDLHRRIKEAEADRDAHDCTISAAQSNYANDDIEIDEDAAVAIVTEDGKTKGVWVQAWVWVETPDLDEEED